MSWRRAFAPAGLALISVVACAAGENLPLDDSTSDASIGVGGSAPTADAELYASRCGGCHGASGEGSVIAPQVQRPVFGYASYVVRNGRADMGYPAGMAAIDATALSDEDLASVLGWLAERPKPTQGAGLYTVFCANCHGAAAEGGRSGKQLSSGDLEELREAVREGEGGDDYGARSEYMPAWTAGELSDPEIESIAGYLATVVEPGGDDDDDDDDD